MVPDAVTVGRERRCPLCDGPTTAVYCPTDGTATLVRGIGSIDVPAIEPGRVVAGRYRVESFLGRGGSALVFEARHVGTNHPVAIKVLRTDGSEDETRLLRFFQEARVTAHLAHPNTIRVFDFGQDDAGFVYIAMELLTGPTLRLELGTREALGRPFTEDEVIDIGVAVTRSLGEAHAQALIHRDLKPENLMFHRLLGDLPMLKVLDFGIAKLSGHALTTAQVLCTPSYASPEQITGGPLTGRSDLYSLGTVLYELITGVTPFGGENKLETVYKQVHAPLPDVRAHARTPISDELARVLERALAKDAAARFADAAEMRAALERCRTAPRFAATEAETLPGLEPEAAAETLDESLGVVALDQTAINSRTIPDDPAEADRTAAAPVRLLDRSLQSTTALLPARPAPKEPHWLAWAALAIVLGAALVLAWAVLERDTIVLDVSDRPARTAPAVPEPAKALDPEI